MIERSPTAEWKEAIATVIYSDYRYAQLRDLNMEDGLDHSFFVISFSYLVDGETFYDDFEQHEPMEVGDHFNILYDPTNPSINNLTKVEKTMLSRALTWSVGIAFVAFLIYLQRHFNIPDEYELPGN